MNKKAFTLVEVIAVIAIIAVISILVVPKVTTMIKSSRSNAYNTTILTIKESAKTYVYLNSNSVDAGIVTNEYYDVTLLELQQSGLLEVGIKNPNTDLAFNTSSSVRITKSGNTYSYSFTLVE